MNFMPGSGFYQDISSSPNYPSYQPYPSSSSAAADSDEGTSAAPPLEREHMFDKVVTPSDVGKLNRLVIPKQHAEKYFPLDSSAHEKGLLLNFEDRNGKPWRFRYSYWNSSQSYVMTKGWSRFVKEKKLDAGDIVSFQRGVGESAKDRLFIDWRRRPDAPEIPPSLPSYPIRPWNSLFIPPPPSRSEYSRYFHPSSAAYYPPAPPYAGGSNYGYTSNRVVNGNPCGTGSIVYLSSVAGMEAFNTQLRSGPAQPEIAGHGEAVFNAVPVVQGKAAAKRLRLFGVNMDCPISDSDDCDEMASSNSTMPLSLPTPEDYPSPSSSAPRHGSYKGCREEAVEVSMDTGHS